MNLEFVSGSLAKTSMLPARFSTMFFLIFHAYGHLGPTPFYSTLSDFHEGQGSQGKWKAKSVGFISSHASQLIRVMFGLELK